MRKQDQPKLGARSLNIFDLTRQSPRFDPVPPTVSSTSEPRWHDGWMSPGGVRSSCSRLPCTWPTGSDAREEASRRAAELRVAADLIEQGVLAEGRAAIDLGLGKRRTNKEQIKNKKLASAS